jgi:phytoene dehydrogenase-like protein
MTTASSPTIVIGAGIAGLVAAIELQRAGRAVQVIEQAPEVGGRVRTTQRDGFLLDHGFQVLFTAYPVLNRYLDHAALALRPFQPAARLVRDTGRAALVGDALSDPSLLLPSLTDGALPVTDLWRMLRLRQFATARSVDACFAPEFTRLSTREFLTQRGFSARTIDGFFAPFYGGILLDRSLQTRASVLLFTFKMLAEGRTAVPAAGMGAIPAQLAAQLAGGSVRCGVGVRSITRTDGRADGVVLDDGTTLPASDVVLATDLVSARALAHTAEVSLEEPRAVLGCTTVYYAGTSSVLPGRALWLNARAGATVSHAITLSEVAPEYAPPGRTLVAATVLGEAATQDDPTLDALVRADLARMTPTHSASDQSMSMLERVAVWRVPLSQFAQPVLAPPSNAAPQANTALPHLVRASEVLHSSSLEGAARGGVMAARTVLTQGAQA